MSVKDSKKVPEPSWFQQHPVVSTVLWIMGTSFDDGKGASSSQPKIKQQRSDNCSSSSSSVEWKRDQSGSISEYILHVQNSNLATQSERSTTSSSCHDDDSPSADSCSRSNNDSTCNSSSSKNPHITGGTQLAARTIEARNRLASKADSTDGDGDPSTSQSQSPQWGFYVPITPPQPEMFPSAPGTAHHSAVYPRSSRT